MSELAGRLTETTSANGKLGEQVNTLHRTVSDLTRGQEVLQVLILLLDQCLPTTHPHDTRTDQPALDLYLPKSTANPMSVAKSHNEQC